MKALRNIPPKKDRKYPFRVRLAGEIVAEIILPERQMGKVAIVATGLPSSPSKGDLLHFLADQGYVAVLPRYRGTWESEGRFLEYSPTQDIADVIDVLAGKEAVTDLVTGEALPIRAVDFHLFGSSFGGPAVILNSAHPSVKKVVAISPVLDWKKEGEDEPFDRHIRFVMAGFGGAYRVRRDNDWQKLIETDFYNPLSHVEKILGEKVFILHALDDRVVPFDPIPSFSAQTGAAYYLKPHGGHHLRLTHRFLWKKISRFLSTNK